MKIKKIDDKISEKVLFLDKYFMKVDNKMLILCGMALEIIFYNVMGIVTQKKNLLFSISILWSLVIYFMKVFIKKYH